MIARPQLHVRPLCEIRTSRQLESEDVPGVQVAAHLLLHVSVLAGKMLADPLYTSPRDPVSVKCSHHDHASRNTCSNGSSTNAHVAVVLFHVGGGWRACGQGPWNLYGRDGKFRLTFKSGTETRLLSVLLLMT